MSEFPIHDRGVQGDLTPSVALEGESGSAGSGSPSSSAASTECDCFALSNGTYGAHVLSCPNAPTDECMCLAFDADSDEQGWRPCPTNLCEREDHKHHPDWLVTFAHKVAIERDLDDRHPGHRFCVMLNRKEAEGLLEHIVELVPGA